MIQINLEDHTGNVQRQAKMDESASVAKLIPALITALGLPSHDQAGRPITYRLSFNERQLEEEESLRTAGVRNGDMISLIPEFTAGGVSSPRKWGARRRPLIELGQEISAPLVQNGLPEFATRLPPPLGTGVCLTAAALAKIKAHAQSQAEVEVAGLLTGQVYAEAERFVVLVEDIQRAQQTIATCVSLQLTGASWQEILKERASQPRATTLGWYHSHPGLGIFLSETDRFTHQHFFGTERWYVALVFDPCADAYGAFTWQGEALNPTEVLIV